jgi:predicted RNA-binding protein YlqC (UPF0109 family)
VTSVDEDGSVEADAEGVESAASDGGAALDPARSLAVTEYLVKALADSPEDVSVSAEVSGDTARLTVDMARADVGRIIGKRGRVAGSIRSVVRAAAYLDGHKVDVDFD